MITKKKVFTGTIKFIAATTTTGTIHRLIKTGQYYPTTRRQKASTWVGSGVLGMMAGEAAEKWVERQIDDLIDQYQESKSTTL